MALALLGLTTLPNGPGHCRSGTPAGDQRSEREPRETLTGATASAAVVVLLSVVATHRTPRPSARVGFIQDAAAARP